MSKQPEALRLADTLLAYGLSEEYVDAAKESAYELRRLHEVNQELVEALKGSLWRMERYNYQAMEGTITRAKAAIAKAEGEQA